MDRNDLLALILVFVPLSILSFGGGQAVLPDIQHQAVAVHGWLTDAQFTDLFAISRAAPGPSTLIVALIGWHVAGFAGALVATIAIFLPSSLVVFTVGRWWQRNEKSPLKIAIERGMAPVAVGLIFAGALTVLRSAHAGWLQLVTVGAVCFLLQRLKISNYAIMAAVAAVYLTIQQLGY
jgi:chromate transporter